MDEKQLREAVYKDDLTDLANRRHLDRRLPEELKQAESAKKPLSLLILDVASHRDLYLFGG